jgi:hypothetical protein
VGVYVWKGGSGTLSVAGGWTDSGTGGTALAAPGTRDSASLIGAAAGLILASGTLAVGTLAESGGVAVAGRVAADTLSATGALVVAAGGLLTASTAGIAGSLATSGTTRVAGILTVGGGIGATGGGALSAGGLVLSGGTLALDALSSVIVGAGPGATGAVTVAAGATLTGSGTVQASTIALAGVIRATGTIGLFGAVAGAGTLAIAPGATLFAAGPVGTGASVVFAQPTAGSGGTLDLFTSAAAFAGSISGFAPGDAIDIASSAIATAAWSGGVLTLTDGGGTKLALAVPDTPGQTYESAIFLPLPDGLGGTDIVMAPPGVASPNGVGVLTIPAGTESLFVGGFVGVPTLLDHGLLILTQHEGATYATIDGTLAAYGAGGFLSGPSAAASGLLLAVGTGASVQTRGVLALSGTLAAEGGGWDAIGTIALAGGAVTLDPASFVTLGTAAPETGTIAVAPGASLAGFGRVAAPVDNAGALLAQGGMLALDAPVGGAGSVEIGPGATLAVLGPLTQSVAFDAGATLELIAAASLVTGTLQTFAAGDVLDVAGARIDSAVWAAGTLSLIGGGLTVGTLAMAGSFASLGWTTTSDGAGGTNVTIGTPGATALTVTGTLAVTGTDAAPSATIAPGGLVAMHGGTLSVATVALPAGATLAGTGTVAAAVSGAGALSVAAGALAVTGALTGGVQATIGTGGTLFAEAGFDAASRVTFLGSGGTLMLASNGLAAAGLIVGFGPGAGIDIAGATVVGGTWTTLTATRGLLALSGAAGPLGTLTVIGAFDSTQFLAHPDGFGGSVVSEVPSTLANGVAAVAGSDATPIESVACFAPGTHIATPTGDRPVESLRPGDWVLTPCGPRRLRWAGHRTCDMRAAPEARPVRIAAGALAALLGARLPTRDLILSPQHALLLHDALVPAVALVGIPGIRRDEVDAVTYHHLGLEPHTTVLAEGVPAETYLPLAATHFDGEFGRRPLPGPACARRLEGGAALAALCRALQPRLRERPARGPLRGHLERVIDLGGATRLEGWAFDGGPAVALTVYRGGRRAGVALANRWRPDLDRAGLAGGHCAFDLDLPGPPGPILLRRRADGAPLPPLHPT